MINIEKFLCSLFEQKEMYHGEPLTRSNIQEALRDQGYEISNGKIIEINLKRHTPKFKIGDNIRHRENPEICHVIEAVDITYDCYRCTDGSVLGIKIADEKYIISDLPSDVNLILEWFDHIEQLATDRKTLNDYVMSPEDTLDEIKVLAKNSQEYIKIHIAPEKIMFAQRDIDQMVCKFKNEPLRSDGRVADIYRRGIEDTLKELKLHYGGQKTTD
jgi:hypothetical protein